MSVFGTDPASVITDDAGNTVSELQLQVWTAKNGTQITALNDLAGNPLPGVVTSDARGRVPFQVEDNRLMVTLKAPDGSMWDILSSDLPHRVNAAIQDAAEAKAAAEEALQGSAEIASVTRFGAAGDGTTDDTVAFQACLDFLEGSGGGTMVIPPGTYAVAGTNPIRLRSNITIQGDGATLIKASMAFYAMFIAVSGGAAGYGASVQNVNVQGLRFRGDLSSGDTIGCFALHHAENLTFERCVFDQVQRGGHVFDMGGCRNIAIRDCIWYGFDPGPAPTAETIQLDTSYIGAVSYPDAAGSYDGLPCTDVLVEACQFLPSGSYPAPNPIGSHTTWEGEYHNNIRFLNNLIVDPAEQVSPADGDNQGRNFGTIHLPATKNLIIAGNTFRQTKARSTRVISVHSMSSGYLATSDPNQSPAAQGPWAAPVVAENITIRDNTFDGFNGATIQEMIWLHGLPTGYVRNVTITGNVFRNGFQDPATVSFLAAAVAAKYTEGLLVDSAFDSVQMALYANTCRDVRMIGSTIRAAAAYPAIAASSVGVVFSNNIIEGVGRSLTAQAGQEATISNNTIRNPHTAGANRGGIVISGAQAQFAVIGNTITASGTAPTHGIQLSATCTNGIVTNNVITGFTNKVSGSGAGNVTTAGNI